MKNPTIRTIFVIWLAWVLLVIGFQYLATARLQPTWPDAAQRWTLTETGSNYQKNRAYLLEPFMNNQVAWDSEYYLGIAIGGYDDPLMPALSPKGWTIPGVDQRRQRPAALASFNNALKCQQAYPEARAALIAVRDASGTRRVLKALRRAQQAPRRDW